METEKKTFKTMTVGEKLEHIWEYYKLALLIIALAVGLIIYIIYKLVAPGPDSILNVTMVNSYPLNVEGEDTFDRYLREHGYDPKDETVAVNSTLYLDANNASQSSAVAFQALLAMSMVGEIDLLIGDETVFQLFGSGNGLLEIDTVLPEELLEKYQDDLYTARAQDTGEEFVCGIRLPKGNPLEQDGYYGEGVMAGIPYTAVNQDEAKEMLLYLLGENEQ